MKNILTLSLLLAALVGCGTTPKLPAQSVYFIEPKDGAVVGAEVKVVMGIKGMEVMPAGAVVANAGHHHLLIDTAQLNSGEAIPTGTDKYLHFGKGQTETTIKLTPGTHTLTLQFADGTHVSYGDKMRSTITVTVK
jgi:S-adenosylhomocysteine hydrolase